MKLKVVAVYDNQVKAYLEPRMYRTNGEALRALLNGMEDEKTNFNKHPEDFTLFEIAEYDEETGTYFPLTEKNRIANLWELTNKTNKVAKIS